MTFPSTLIIGSEYNLLLESLGHFSMQNPDLLVIDSDYSVESIRQIDQFLKKLSYNHQNKVILIKNAQNLETVAQNTLLKSLEEPGENNYFILTTNKLSQIIPTIVSRCQLIIQKNEAITISPQLSTPVDIKSALQISTTIDKNNIKETLLNELNFLQSELIKNPSPKISEKIKVILKSLEYVDSNLDPRLALDYYLLSMV